MKKRKKITSELCKILKEEESAYWQNTRYELSISTLDLSEISGGGEGECEQCSLDGEFYFNSLENAKKAKQIIIKMIEDQVRTEYDLQAGKEENIFWKEECGSDYHCFWRVGKITKITEEEID